MVTTLAGSTTSPISAITCQILVVLKLWQPCDQTHYRAGLHTEIFPREGGGGHSSPVHPSQRGPILYLTRPSGRGDLGYGRGRGEDDTRWEGGGIPPPPLIHPLKEALYCRPDPLMAKIESLIECANGQRSAVILMQHHAVPRLRVSLPSNTSTHMVPGPNVTGQSFHLTLLRQDIFWSFVGTI